MVLYCSAKDLADLMSPLNSLHRKGNLTIEDNVARSSAFKAAWNFAHSDETSGGNAGELAKACMEYRPAISRAFMLSPRWNRPNERR